MDKKVRDRLRDFFFEAMTRGGYALGSEYIPHPTGVGEEKRWNFNGEGRFEGLTLLDQYYVHPQTGKSTGFTEIVDSGNLAWLMTYNGKYQKRVVPFLKKALLVSFQLSQFVGGRGPASFSEGELAYANVVTNLATDPFEKFLGVEEIRGAGGDLLGQHHYSGYLLAD